MLKGRLGLAVGALTLALAASLTGGTAATADGNGPAALTYKTDDFISLTAFTADYAKRSVSLKYKIKKALPDAKSKIELVLLNTHASAPQFLQVSDASVKVGTTYTLTYPVAASVPIDRFEASATLLTPLGGGVLQRNNKLTLTALYAPSGTATGKLTLTSTHISKQAFSVPTSSYVSVDASLATAKQLRLSASVPTAYSSGLKQDNVSDKISKSCTLAAGNYVEATATFAAGKSSASAVDIMVTLKAWTSSAKKTKAACSDISVTLNYLS